MYSMYTMNEMSLMPPPHCPCPTQRPSRNQCPSAPSPTPDPSKISALHPHPVHTMLLSAHQYTPHGWDFQLTSPRNVPRCTPQNPSGLGLLNSSARNVPRCTPIDPSGLGLQSTQIQKELNTERTK